MLAQKQALKSDASSQCAILKTLTAKLMTAQISDRIYLAIAIILQLVFFTAVFLRIWKLHRLEKSTARGTEFMKGRREFIKSLVDESSK